MERRELIQFAMTLTDATEDYPFDDPDKTILRHNDNRKWFALIFTRDQHLFINVKTSPWEVDALCENYQGITPGWHMNKRHWISIDVNSDVAKEDIYTFMKESYQLTQSRKKL